MKHGDTDILAIKKQQLLERYASAPKRIRLISRTETEDENGGIWHLGISPMLIKLDATTLSSPRGRESSPNLALAHALCNAARAVNLSPNFAYPKPEMGAKAITGALTPYFTLKDRFCFVLAKNAKPSEAMRSLLAPVTDTLIIECNMAMHIMEYTAILDFLGDQAFDELFTSIGITIARTTLGNQICKFRNQINGNWRELALNQKKFLAELIPGDIIYIRNITPYLNRHAFGESCGHNVVYLGRNADGVQEFAGLFTIKRIRNFDEIIELLVEDYNQIPYHIIDDQNRMGNMGLN